MTPGRVATATACWPCWTATRRPGRGRRPGAEGFAGDAVQVLQGDRDADRIDSLGNVGGTWARARRLLSFTLADQAVDMAVYVAALRDGRTVLSVLAPGDAARERARRALAGAGAHFMNFFGRFATVDIAPWRGAGLPLPPGCAASPTAGAKKTSTDSRSVMSWKR